MYLGSIIDKHGGTDADVKGRFGKARRAFIQLKNIWSSKVLPLHTKICLFNSNMKSVLQYGAETWRTTNATIKKVQTFINNCLRRSLQICWPNTVSNKDLWEKTHWMLVIRSDDGGGLVTHSGNQHQLSPRISWQT